jgi:Alkylmercury lyase
VPPIAATPLTTSSAGRLHFELLRGLVDNGALPSREELQARLACASSEELDRTFDELADLHGVVLHPGSREVWAIHPFSLAPTPFLVESGDKRWWGNCAWCSLGIAVLVGGRSVITTTLGAETEQIQLTVDHGVLDRTDLVVHFPIPMTRAWDNVVYTCSLMLLFEDEGQVDSWCARHRLPRGDVQPVARVFELAKRWYGQHLDPHWTKKSLAEARSLFTELGLVHPVWSLPASDGHF